MNSTASAQENATVLPKGANRIRSINILTSNITHLHGTNGDRNELMAPLNMTLSAASQAASNAGLQNLYEKLNMVESGLGDKLFQTQIQSQGQLSFHRIINAYEIGATPRLSFGIIVPVIAYRASATFSANTESQAMQILENRIKPMGSAGAPLAKGLQEFEANLPSREIYENAIFTSKGYKVPSQSSGAGLGDIELGLKWQFYKGSIWSSSLQSGFRFPTASLKKDYTDLLSQTSGDNQLDYGVYHQNDLFITPFTVFNFSNKFTFQFSNREYRPAPSLNQIGLTDLNNPDNWDTITRNLGDIFESEASLTQYFYEKHLNTYLSYQYLHKGKDSYKGNKVLDYDAIGKDTQALAHRLELGIGMSNIPSYLKKKTSIPLEMKASYNVGVYGKNVPDLNYARFDLYLYF